MDKLKMRFKKSVNGISWINKNFTPVFKLLFGVMSLSLLFQANSLVHSGNIVAKEIGLQANEISEKQLEDTAPSLSFNRKSYDDGNFYYVLNNERGHMSNVSFYQFDRINFHANNKQFSVNADVMSKNIYKGKAKKNHWIFDSSLKNFDINKLIEQLNKQLNEKLQTNDFMITSTSYYYVSYNDFRNEKKSEYYRFKDKESGEGIYDEYMTIRNDEIENNIKRYYTSIFTRQETKSSDDVYKNQATVLSNSIMNYYNMD
ncbi:hypothetical protein ABID30_001594 [Enterococcus rotai]|uniref:Uncharacterized protein n=1 Tax=Enterococcus rotai TaxID=118060 RepID=A0A0U2XK12_9ENTE|nr:MULTISPECIES: hypothetical protein [Enterococcus]ALS37613.1 hypothetical protein ATZ35_10745 [Enterococcus rotai]MBO0445701.1 hypothetical protein [Enterococcus ureilyticus]